MTTDESKRDDDLQDDQELTEEETLDEQEPLDEDDDDDSEDDTEAIPRKVVAASEKEEEESDDEEGEDEDGEGDDSDEEADDDDDGEDDEDDDREDDADDNEDDDEEAPEPRKGVGAVRNIIMLIILVGAGFGFWYVHFYMNSAAYFGSQLKDSTVAERLQVIQKLKELGPEAAGAVPEMITLLDDDHPGVRGQTSMILTDLARENAAVTTMLKQALSDAPEARKAAITKILKEAAPAEADGK
jgi:hypothetical protein